MENGAGIFQANVDQNLYYVDTKKNMKREVVARFENSIITDLATQDITGNGVEELVVVDVRNDNSASTLSVYIKNGLAWDVLYSKELSSGVYKLHSNNNDLYMSSYPTADVYPAITHSRVYQVQILGDSIVLVSDPFDMIDDGCITDIAFGDWNGDGLDDLIVVGEWMSPQVILQKSNGYEKIELTEMAKLSGMWQDVCVEDLDGDGDQDFILSNLGANTRLRASVKYPLYITGSDLNGNGSVDPLMSLYNANDNESYSYASRDDIAKKLPSIKQAYTSYAKFADVSYSQLIDKFDNSDEKKMVTCLSSIILQNDGEGKFKVVKLPEMAQHSIINNIATFDYNEDMRLDLMLLSNHDRVEMHNGDIDGLNGLVLINEGNMKFTPVESRKSGLSIAEAAEDVVHVAKDRYWISSSQGIYSLKRID